MAIIIIFNFISYNYRASFHPDMVELSSPAVSYGAFPLAQLYSTLLYSTLLYSTLLYSTRLFCASIRDSI